MVEKFKLEEGIEAFGFGRIMVFWRDSGLLKIDSDRDLR